LSDKRRIEWDFSMASGQFILGYHLALLIGLPIYLLYAMPAPGIWVAGLIVLSLCTLSIGGSYHRFYSHSCYRLNPVADAMLLFFATLTFQGSAIRWSHDHRKHHAHVDTDQDPYNIKRGFWYAHVLWLFEKEKPLDESLVRDLMKNRLAVFQHKYYAWLAIGSNVAVWLFTGWLLNDFLGAFVIVWWLRLFVSHHLTWFINSLAHIWGEQTYSRELSAVDNYFLAFFTGGEGYHNYHHTFASDYRNGVRWYHFDPTKWMVWALSKLGLARDLKRYDKQVIRQRLIKEDRRLLLETLTREAHTTKVGLEEKVNQLAERMRAKLHRIAELAEELRTLKRRKAGKFSVRAARRELRVLEQSLRRDWKSWSNLCGLVLQPAAA